MACHEGARRLLGVQRAAKSGPHYRADKIHLRCSKGSERNASRLLGTEDANKASKAVAQAERVGHERKIMFVIPESANRGDPVHQSRLRVEYNYVI